MKQETTSPKRRFETVFCKEELPAETNKEYLTQLGWLYFGYLNEDKQWYDNNLDEYLFPDYWLKEVESLSPVTDGDAENYLQEKIKKWGNVEVIKHEPYIHISSVITYGRMKVAEETKELNHHIRERAAAIEKIFKLEKELEQLKSAKVEGVITDKDFFKWFEDYDEILNRIPDAMACYNWMRERLMPLINNKPDDKFEFVEWIVTSNYRKSLDLGKGISLRWYINIPNGKKYFTTEQLYQKFLSRNEEPES